MSLSVPSSQGQVPYRVMLVDDSSIIRGILTKTLESDESVKVVASCCDGMQAIQALKMALKNPAGKIEVIVLDIEMPVMDGLTAIPKLLEVDRDVQIIVASTLTLRNAEISLKALQAGAIDYLAKPSASRDLNATEQFKNDILSKVKGLASNKRGKSDKSSVYNLSRNAILPSTTQTSSGQSNNIARESHAAAPLASSGKIYPASALSLLKTPVERPRALAIGSSTGGPQALIEFFSNFRGNLVVPVFITQHMPATFTTILADHLRKASGCSVVEASNGMSVEAGWIYVAPGGYHMTVMRDPDSKMPKIRLNQEPPENFCRPSVDPMLRSLVKVYERQLMTVIFTGMGQDGLNGCKEVIKAGGSVFAQDEATSVVWGMPGAVATAGICHDVLPLKEMFGRVCRYIQKG